MKKYVIALALLVITGFAVQAQEIYMPRNVKQAYVKQTRNKNGKPGQRYWQNTGRYNIQVTVAPPSRTVQGIADIRYVNNSPDTLRTLAIRLLTNLHKFNAPRSGYHSPDFLTSGVVVDSMIVNGKPVKFNNNIGTVGAVKLPAPLPAKDSIQLRFRWHYDLSKESGREGCIDSTTFYLAYFYPRVSVYDDYNGWDMLEHTDRAEFYSDFNDYEVAVTVPRNYVVWGTGDLLNAAQVLQPAPLERLKSSYGTDDIIHVATAADMDQQKVTAQKDLNTWHFRAADIADVTYGLSNHYVWDATSAVVDSATKRRASMQAAYNRTAIDFPHATRFGQFALNWFSHHWPGIPYPFPVMTAFQGFADMEYPMMVNDATMGNDLDFAQMLQDHEMAHTYFPFYMGINETRYAFMDEGWTVVFEYLIGIAEKGKSKADETFKKFRVRKYIGDPSAEEDQPIITMSTQVSGMGYGSNSYGKAALAYLGLKDLLGDDGFRKCLHNYMADWHGKHPTPWDFFYSFNATAGRSLNWYWNNWFFSNNYIDLRITSLNEKVKKQKIAAINITNIGGFAIPFDVVITNKDGMTQRQHFTPAVWEKNMQEITVEIPVTGTISGITIDNGLFMDATPGNNTWPMVISAL